MKIAGTSLTPAATPTSAPVNHLRRPRTSSTTAQHKMMFTCPNAKLVVAGSATTVASEASTVAVGTESR
jgi:hypothetical protein